MINEMEKVHRLATINTYAYGFNCGKVCFFFTTLSPRRHILGHLIISTPVGKMPAIYQFRKSTSAELETDEKRKLFRSAY